MNVTDAMQGYSPEDFSSEEVRHFIVRLFSGSIRASDLKSLKKCDLQDLILWMIAEQARVEICRQRENDRRKDLEAQFVAYQKKHPEIPDTSGIIDRLQKLVKEQQKEILRLSSEAVGCHD